MKYPRAIRIAVLAAVTAALGTGAAVAQTQSSTPVLTDVSPLPAEDRSSPGAIVLEKSLVRAQRDNEFQRSSARTGVGTVGTGILRATARSKTEADLAQARETEAVQLYDGGAATLIKK
jgi:hypothetical protein